MQQTHFLSYVGYIVVLLLAGTACKSSRPVDQNSDGTAMTWEVVAEGAYGAVETASNQLITDADSWASLWEQISQNRFPTPALPEVDFASKNLIACFMGMQTSGGHSISIQSMTPGEEVLAVKVLQESPGQNCMVTDAITYPYVIVAVSKARSVSTTFEVETRTHNCDQ